MQGGACAPPCRKSSPACYCRANSRGRHGKCIILPSLPDCLCACPFFQSFPLNCATSGHINKYGPCGIAGAQSRANCQVHTPLAKLRYISNNIDIFAPCRVCIFHCKLDRHKGGLPFRRPRKGYCAAIFGHCIAAVADAFPLSSTCSALDGLILNCFSNWQVYRSAPGGICGTNRRPCCSPYKFYWNLRSAQPLFFRSGKR